MGCWTKLKSSEWVYPTTVISLYGFFANCLVAEPFLVSYLTGPHKNISGEVVTNFLFPVWTYSFLTFLLPVFLLADFFRHKPLIMLRGLLHVIQYILLCFVQGLPAMTYLQVNFGAVSSTEVAYYSYIYSVIPDDKYQRATSYVRSATLAGYTFGASLSQILVSFGGLDYFYLNVLTLGMVSIAFLVTFWLPMPKRSLFFKRKRAAKEQQSQKENTLGGNIGEEPAVMDLAGRSLEEEKTEHDGCCSRQNVASAASLLWKSFRESYSSRYLIYWSLWWALATAGYLQIFNYVQLLWDHIEPSATSSIYNGGAEAACSVAGAAAAFSVGFIQVNWVVWGELALGMFSAMSAGALFLMAFTRNIWLSYTGYCIFKSCHMFLITITTYQIAYNLSMECYALTFGINTFIALLLQTILTVVVVDEAALGLDIVTQFIVYGSYYGTISLLFVIRGIYTASISRSFPLLSKAKEQETTVEVISTQHF